jgi:UTP-glucose-1-phosphate uridylyltransferase
MTKKKTIVQKHKDNFDTLTDAFKNGEVLLMDCINKKSKEHEAVICAYVFDGTDYNITPFARFYNGNPFKMLINPNEPSYDKR